ncbi:MAG: EAL domain-containing protein, partial [Lachnospiraceae bacterium]
MLKKMPIDILKIDKSFLDFDLDMDIRDEIVIRDIVEMGKHLDLQTIAEGVETKEQSDFLENIGCDIAQGYFYGKPMPVEEFEDLLLKEYGQGGAC